MLAKSAEDSLLDFMSQNRNSKWEVIFPIIVGLFTKTFLSKQLF